MINMLEIGSGNSVNLCGSLSDGILKVYNVVVSWNFVISIINLVLVMVILVMMLNMCVYILGIVFWIVLM